MRKKLLLKHLVLGKKRIELADSRKKEVVVLPMVGKKKTRTISSSDFMQF